jgi:hypothetical protein
MVDASDWLTEALADCEMGLFSGAVNPGEIEMKNVDALSAALQVITRDPAIKKFLRENDPQALKQCLQALGEWEPAMEKELLADFKRGQINLYRVEVKGKTPKSSKIGGGYSIQRGTTTMTLIVKASSVTYSKRASRRRLAPPRLIYWLSPIRPGSVNGHTVNHSF